jgi:hypothetical protein
LALGQTPAAIPAKIDFQASVLPILRRSCFTCHAPNASPTPVPPGDDFLAKRRETEIKDGLDAMEMGDQFPFPDDRPADRQLTLMEKKLRRRQMPPEAQKKLGLGVPLSDQETRLLLDWIGQARAEGMK